MLAHFAQRMEEATGVLYDEIERYVRYVYLLSAHVTA